MTGIERSPGLPVRVAGIPYIIGSGSGSTDALNAVADAAAVALRDMFDHPVTIRFNSDRRSGGAWLRTSERDGFGLNTEVEIGVTLARISQMRKSYDEWRDYINKDPEGKTFEESLAERFGGMVDPIGPDEQVIVTTYIKADYLRDRRLVNDDRDDPKEAKAYHYHSTLAQAVEFIRQHVVADPRKVTAARKRARAATRRKLIKDTETALAGLDKMQLGNVVRQLDYKFRPPYFAFTGKVPKENKATLRECIIKAVKAGTYRFRFEDAAGGVERP